MIKKLVATLLLWTTCANAGLPPTSVNGQNQTAAVAFNFVTPNYSVTSLGGIKALFETGNTNLLANPTFQASISSNATTSWTLALGGGTPGTFTADATAANLLEGGTQAGLMSYGASTTGTMSITQTLTPTNIGGYIGMNLMCSIIAKTSSANWNFNIIKNGATTVATQVLPSSNTYQTTSLNFTVNSGDTSFAIQVADSTASTAATIDLGYMYCGRATNLGLGGNSAQFLGSANWPGVASCNWTATASSYADYAVQSSCTLPSGSNLQGAAQAPGTKIPGVLIPAIPAGHVTVIATGTFNKSSATADYEAYQVYDGTSSGGGNSGSNNAASNAAVGTVIGNFDYTGAQTNLTYRIQGYSSGGGTNRIENDQTAGLADFKISVFYYPPAILSQLYRTDVTPASWSGNENLNCSWTTTSASFADFGTAASSSCALTQTTNRNFGTVTNYGGTGTSAKPGIIATPVRTGNYLVCVGGAVSNSTASTVNGLQLYDETNSVILDQTFFHQGTGGNLSTFQLCGIDTLPNTSSTSFGIRGFANSNTLTLGDGTRVTTNWKVVELDAPMPAPYLTGSVTSSSTTLGYRLESANMSAICTSGTCGSVASTAGISSITWSATGSYLVNFVTGTFSATPMCTATAKAASSSPIAVITNESTSSVNVKLWTNTTGTLGNDEFNINCVGQH